MRYGDLPEDLGLIPIQPVEMMFWLYLPVATPTQGITLPKNLEQFVPVLMRAWERDSWAGKYVYLTAKTLYLAENGVANRPGWHTDGFGTDDLNYIWYDRAPTEFIQDDFTLPDDCDDAMAIMSERASRLPPITYPCRHLLRLTPAVVHRVTPTFPAGMRTFLKISVSADRYNLEGNSLNHELVEQWPLVPRQAERNHPYAGGVKLEPKADEALSDSHEQADAEATVRAKNPMNSGSTSNG